MTTSDLMTPGENAIVDVLQYGSVWPEHLAERAGAEVYGAGGTITLEECRIGQASCLDKGWIQIIDERSLQEITRELEEQQILGPIYGLPQMGDVDLTQEGARLLQVRYHAPGPPAFAFTDVVHQKTSRYFRTKSAALKAIDEISSWDDGSLVSLAGPTSIGAWYVQWWRRYPEGYRVDVQEEFHWEGRGGGGNAQWELGFSRPLGDTPRLRNVLDTHNVSLGEWLLLCTVDSYASRYASVLPSRVSAQARELFGVEIPEDECRKSLEACLKNGWLRVVDKGAGLEISSLLHETPAIAPLCHRAGPALGEIDFTLDGAVLYQMIADRLYGRGWDSGISVSLEQFRKEHRYCETEEGISHALRTYADRGEDVRRSQIVPIGPWCVRWWERFTAGFMLEVEIGQMETH